MSTGIAPNGQGCSVCKGRGVVDENGNPYVWGRADSYECSFCDSPDEFDPIPWFTQQHVRESAERMKAWATQSHLALVDQLSDEQWENLARMALDMRPR